jgi:outer membrane lipoprotein-sorting protein
MKMRVGILLVAGCLLAFGASSGQDVQSGEAVVNAMHARYEKIWYDTATFTQKSTTYNADGTTKVETWYEAASLPGKLRIDYGTPSEGNGLVLADGGATSFQAGKQTSSRPLLNLLLVLGFDVYRQSPEITLGQLKNEGIDVQNFMKNRGMASPSMWLERKRAI